MPDQLFGLVLELVLRRKPVESVAEFQSRLRVALAPHCAKKGEELRVEQLHHVRKWVPVFWCVDKADGKDASHAFTFKHRQDLTEHERSQMSRRQRGFEGDDHDVFAVVKPYMHSTASKQPILALPQDRARRVVSRCPGVLVFEQPMAQDRRDELLSWADKLELPQYALHEAAKALRGLVHEPAAPIVCDAPWLAADETAPTTVLRDTGNHMFSHLPDTTWDLLARFHRGEVA